MQTIHIKPLSTNKLFQGRRFRTKEYDRYQEAIISQLQPKKIHQGRLLLVMRVGFSNAMSDLDNSIKAFVDILQKAYGFNDNLIYRIDAEKTIVKKGFEFIEFDIQPYEPATLTEPPQICDITTKPYKRTKQTKTTPK